MAHPARGVLDRDRVLAASLFLAPAVGGKEPGFQWLGANVLFAALIVIKRITATASCRL